MSWAADANLSSGCSAAAAAAASEGKMKRWRDIEEETGEREGWQDKIFLSICGGEVVE